MDLRREMKLSSSPPGENLCHATIDVTNMWLFCANYCSNVVFKVILQFTVFFFKEALHFLLLYHYFCMLPFLQLKVPNPGPPDSNQSRFHFLCSTESLFLTEY